MSNTLLPSLSSTLKPSTRQEIARTLGEPEQAVSRGLDLATAAVFDALKRQTRDSDAMYTVIALAYKAPENIGWALNAGQLTSRSSPLLSGEKRFLSSVLRSAEEATLNAVSRESGLRPASASAVLAVAAQSVLSFIGTRVREGLTANGLSNFLENEGPSLRGALQTEFYEPFTRPSPNFRTASPVIARQAMTDPVITQQIVTDPVIGRQIMTDLVITQQFVTDPVIAQQIETDPVIAQQIETGPVIAQTVTKERSFLFWLVPGLLILLGFFLWSMFRSSSPPVAKAPVATPAPVATAGPALGNFVPRQLADGTTLKIPERGVEGRLLAFIQDPALKPNKTSWFDFDRLLFSTGSATLEPQSMEQLHNMAAILKAYPATRLKIGGYTDNTGNAAKNLKLSRDRARNVTAELVKLGVAKNRLVAKGYGDQHPVADNATEVGRARNRRISMLVTQK